MEILERHGFPKESFTAPNESDEDFAVRIIDTVFDWATRNVSDLDVVCLSIDLHNSEKEVKE